MSQYPMVDDDWEEAKVEEVRPDGDGWTIRRDDGWSFYVPPEGIEPKVGDVARFYGKGIGYTVRGLFLNGLRVFYQTEAEQRAKFEQEQRERTAEKIAQAESVKDATASRIAALSEPMRRRIQKFRTANPDFDWEYLPYELMCCEEAERIAAAFKGEAYPTEMLRRFHELPWEEQQKLVPGMDQGHSGNSFGMACRLACWLLTDPEMAVKDHGALTPLVGCEAYGCPHAPSQPGDGERGNG